MKAIKNIIYVVAALVASTTAIVGGVVITLFTIFRTTGRLDVDAGTMLTAVVISAVANSAAWSIMWRDKK